MSIEFANPRRQHEYEALKEHPLPAHMLLNLGHPVVAIASTYCGFSTFAGREYVASEVVWHKLAAMPKGRE